MDNGYYWVGLFTRLIHFPSIRKTIEFSQAFNTTDAEKAEDENIHKMPTLHTRTKEGLELKVHFAFQYQLIRDQIPDMYKLLSDDYEKIFARVAKNTVLNTACQYIATDYWRLRSQISDKMHEDLKWNFKRLHADVTGFMLLKIDLPDDFEQAIVDTEVTIQEKITEEIMQEVHVGEQVIRNIKAAGNREISNTNSEADAEAEIIM